MVSVSNEDVWIFDGFKGTVPDAWIRPSPVTK